MNSILRTLVFLLLAVSASAQCPPVLLNCSTTPKEICDESPNNTLFWNESYWWDAALSSYNLAEGAVNLQLSVLDSCQTGGISIRYILSLDLDANGTRETIVDSDELPGWNTVYFDNANADSLSGGAARKFDERAVMLNQKYGFALQTINSGDTLKAYVRWNTQQAPDTYVAPELPHGGTHEIEWTVTQNGQVKTCSNLFSLKDCKKPTVVCVNGLAVNIMPTKMITLWDTDFLQYTEDNITPTNLLETGIRKSGTGVGFPLQLDGSPQHSISFDCTELGVQLIELWSRDKVGNADYCETYVVVQDNLGLCQGPIGNSNGKVCISAACNNKPMDEISISVTGSHPALPPIILLPGQNQTGYDGCWLPPNIPLSSDYSVEPGKDNDPLNGVSTYDLILINKHILGLEPLAGPYTQIAADVNKSRSITTFDIVELRKLILGVYTELPNNTSWRFVSKDFVFPNPSNPFQTVFPTSVNFASTPNFPIEFLGIKVGDVNCNAIVHSFSEPSEERSTAALALPDTEMNAGQMLETPLYLPSAADWQGLQFALEFDPEKIELIQVLPGDLPGLNADAFAQAQPGLLTLSWFEAQAQALAAGTPLLQLHWRAKKPLRLSEAVRLQPKQLRPEAYTSEGREQGLELLFGNPMEASPAVIFEPQPNPTAGASVLPIQLSADQSVALELFDLNGRLVFQNQLELPAGSHRLELPASALTRAGVYVWRVQVGDLVRTGKLVRF